MKFLTALQSLAVTSTLAVSLKGTNSLEIKDLSAIHYSNVTLSTLHFKIHNPSTDIVDDCSISWDTSSSIQPGLAPHKCLHGHFEFGFRYGIGNIESFTLVVQRVDGSVWGSSVVTAYQRDPRWICVRNPEEGLQERCVWRGTLKIDL